MHKNLSSDNVPCKFCPNKLSLLAKIVSHVNSVYKQFRECYYFRYKYFTVNFELYLLPLSVLFQNCFSEKWKQIRKSSSVNTTSKYTTAVSMIYIKTFIMSVLLIFNISKYNLNTSKDSDHI